MRFFPVDHEVFPGIMLAKKAVELGGISPCVFNSANEACVDLYLRKKIGFYDIYSLISDALSGIATKSGTPSFADILDADKAAREFVYSAAKG